ncbi:MAG TPA: glutathione S-transferase family protein [Haliangium sp.]|nr:glutathione S-transferase family protein [Haliangium sp.]
MIKLTYFNARGRAEHAHFMLELAGVPYEREGITIEQWAGPDGKQRYLERTPFGQLPMLHDGDLILCQSRAIHRYLARKLGFYGETIQDAARVDEVWESVDEIFADIAGFHWNPKFHETRPQHREAMRAKLALLQRYFARTRVDAEHWVLPGRYTLADVAAAYTLESTLMLHPGLVSELPELERFMRAFFATKGVREYVRSERRYRTFTVSIAQFAGKPEETHHWTD